ncbi:MAG TPA: hypothetical protein VIL86_13295 [Tepidisphaeraceae bacterium]
MALQNGSAVATENLHLNAALLRPGNYTIAVESDGAAAKGAFDLYGHIRKSDFRLSTWGGANGEGVYLCPEYPFITQNGAGTLWGFPPQWTYSMNATPGFNPAGGGFAGIYSPYAIRIGNIRPSANSVFMLFEQGANDINAWNDGLVLNPAPYVYVAGQAQTRDTLGFFHYGGGNLACCDGHVAWMRIDEYKNYVATDVASKPLYGEYRSP